MGVAGQLVCGAGHHPGGGIPDSGDRDAAAHVDEGIAIDVDDDPATGGGDVNTCRTGQSGGKGGSATLSQLTGTRAGNRGDQASLLRKVGTAGEQVQFRCQRRHIDGPSGCPHFTVGPVSLRPIWTLGTISPNSMAVMYTEMPNAIVGRFRLAPVT